MSQRVEEQSPETRTTSEKGGREPKEEHLCWICGNRPFNAYSQFINHIEGDQSNGGKDLMKMRKKWQLADCPPCEEWLEKLQEIKASQEVSKNNSDVSKNSTQADIQAEQEKDDRVSETVERDDQAFSGAYNSSWPQTWDPQQCWQPLVPPWLDHTGPWPSLWGPVQEGTSA